MPISYEDMPNLERLLELVLQHRLHMSEACQGSGSISECYTNKDTSNSQPCRVLMEHETYKSLKLELGMYWPHGKLQAYGVTLDIEHADRSHPCLSGAEMALISRNRIL